ncbi:MAG: glycosyltransferase family 2 protein [Bdellovibrionales bacterium]
MNLTSVSGVLLAYHEEEVITTTINRLAAEFDKITGDWEIVVVGFEGAKDRTNEIVKELGQKDPRVRLVVQKREEKGYGRAFAIGIQAAGKDWIFQSDADGQYEFGDIPKLAERAVDGIAMVHGYRADRQDPMERKVMAFCYNSALKALYFIRLRDVDSAFKLIRRSALEDIKLESKSGFCVAEMVIQMKRKKGKMVQLPITHLPRIHGEALAEKGIKNPMGLQLPNPTLVFGTLGEMFRYRF